MIIKSGAVFVVGGDEMANTSEDEKRQPRCSYPGVQLVPYLMAPIRHSTPWSSSRICLFIDCTRAIPKHDAFMPSPQKNKLVVRRSCW